MYQRLPHMVVWALAFAVIVAITATDGAPASAAPYTAPQSISTLVAGTSDVLEPTVMPNVGITAAQIPVAVVTSRKLPSTSTSNVYAPLMPVNFIQGFALGFALVLIGGLLLLGSRRSV